MRTLRFAVCFAALIVVSPLKAAPNSLTFAGTVVAAPPGFMPSISPELGMPLIIQGQDSILGGPVVQEFVCVWPDLLGGAVDCRNFKAGQAVAVEAVLESSYSQESGKFTPLFIVKTVTANAGDPFEVVGTVAQTASVLYWNSAGTPAVMTFTVQDSSGELIAIYCRRPYLAACMAVFDASNLGKKVDVTGFWESFAWSATPLRSARQTNQL